jgi:hypothetical protein
LVSLPGFFLSFFHIFSTVVLSLVVSNLVIAFIRSVAVAVASTGFTIHCPRMIGALQYLIACLMRGRCCQRCVERECGRRPGLAALRARGLRRRGAPEEI